MAAGRAGTVMVVLSQRAARGEGLIVGRGLVLLFWMGRRIIFKAGLFNITGGKSRGAGGGRWI
jgi:hypothetical protein